MWRWLLVTLAVVAGAMAASGAATGESGPHGSPPTRSVAPQALAIEDDQLFLHPLDDLADRTLLGTTAVPLEGLAFDPLGRTLYGLEENDAFNVGFLGVLELDGTYTPLGTIQIPLFWSSLTFDPRTEDGVLYAGGYNLASGFSAVYEVHVDQVQGGAIPVTLRASFFPPVALHDIAMDCGGRMFGFDWQSNTLWAIDLDSSAAEQVGPLGIQNLSRPATVTFDRTSGELYAYVYDLLQSPERARYGTVDLGTGALTTLAEGFSVNWIGETRTICPDLARLFEDGFESGDTSAWSATVQ